MSWKTKIEKSVAGDLQPGETLIDGVLINPSGHTMKLAALGAGGLIGAAIAHRAMKGDDLDAVGGSAALLPNEPLVFGLTDKRLIVWGWGKMLGKPKGFKVAFPLADVAGMETETRKASVAVALVFTDGTGVTREAPRLANDAEAFATALNAARSTS